MAADCILNGKKYPPGATIPSALCLSDGKWQQPDPAKTKILISNEKLQEQNKKLKETIAKLKKQNGHHKQNQKPLRFRKYVEKTCTFIPDYPGCSGFMKQDAKLKEKVCKANPNYPACTK